MKKKNAFFTFCFSLIPGAGQMYQNYMKRGVSIMSLFVACIALVIILSTPIFILPCVVIYAYSFFDTFNIRNKEKIEDEPHDEYIWNKILGESNFNTKLFRKNRVLGVILILAGIYLILNNVVLNITSYYEELRVINRLIIQISKYLPRIIVALLSIFIGMKMLTNKD